MSISRAITWHAEQDPDRVSVADHERSVTRRELDLRSNRLARAYQEMGVVRDDLVTVALPNGVELYESCCAIWKLGAVPQPVSYRLPERERRQIVELADARIVVGAEIAGRPTVPAGFDPAAYDDGLLPDEAGFSWKAPTSGGSTGRPKIILSGTPGLVDPEVSATSYVPRDGVQLVPGPLYHNGPFIYSMRGLLTGMRIQVMPRFDAETVLRLVEQERVTWMLLVPTMMQRLWRLPEEVRNRYDLSSLERFLHLGAPCPPWLKEEIIGWLGAERVDELYAGTESQAVAFISGPEWLQHKGSVGRALIGEMKVLHPETFEEMPPGELGEVFQLPRGGPGATYSYIGAEARAVDGWESLGDLGWMDADGYLFLADRSKDLILSGGANVYPAEVEAVLDEHPAVRSSCVVGLPDDDLGERVHAIVDVAGHEVTADELLRHVAESLVRYKVPRTVEIVREPLRDDAGKMRRTELRAARITTG